MSSAEATSRTGNETRPVLAAIAWFVAVSCVVLIIVLAAANLVRPTAAGGRLDSLWLLSWIGFPLVGAIVASRLPDNRIGWLLLGTGACISLGISTVSYAQFDLTSDVALPAVPYAGIAGSMLVAAGFSLVPFVVLLFPHDRLGRGWTRIAKVAAGVFVVEMIVWALVPSFQVDENLHVDNPIPLAHGPVGDVAQALTGPIGVVFVAFALAAVGRSVILYRRSEGVERLQRKWVAFAAALFPVLMLAGTAVSTVDEFAGQVVIDFAFVIALNGVAAAIAIAILRYRLYDLDVVINKTLLYGALALFITVVYVGIVVGVGALVGAGDEPNLLLSITATSVVAVAFQPVRRRLQRVANRVVYGQRATPYELLSGLSHHVTGTGDKDGDVVDDLVALVGEGTGAVRVGVWEHTTNGLEPRAVWPTDGSGFDTWTVAPDLSPIDGQGRTAVAILREGRDLGVLAVEKAAGETVTSGEQRVLRDVAAGLGLVLHNARLTRGLRDRVAALESSRRRLLATQDEVRQDLEQLLREGPQQSLTEIEGQVRAVHAAASRTADNHRVPALLTQLATTLADANTAIQDFARGLYPQVLVDEGLDGALHELAETAPLTVSVHTAGVSRQPRDTEAAIYFLVSEALQNIAKYANAASAHVAVRETEGHLDVEIADDGDGFDPNTVRQGAGTTNMRERVDALGGQLTINSAPGSGTTVRAMLPSAATGSKPVGR